MTLDELHHLGFDDSEADEESPGYLRLRCSQCVALFINGVPCHERGCRNQGRECRECGAHIQPGEGCDCLDPLDDDNADIRSVTLWTEED
ncbi:hypothetical protein UFOVP703_34 [uncultured Caudovirales phage]|uniref:Uncharacterized protein n=1 Tax=uncultured Caudovirales phage TaxID=2100421 RepID=A0A6J5NN46_9CAUD|nr:hypothetical protein UFOVP703_34 [uncultured Caudovirales phage]